jgi:hypothetical protein
MFIHFPYITMFHVKPIIVRPQFYGPLPVVSATKTSLMECIYNLISKPIIPKSLYTIDCRWFSLTTILWIATVSTSNARCADVDRCYGG